MTDDTVYLDPVVLIPKGLLSWPGLKGSRLLTYIAVRSFTWRKNSDRTIALATVAKMSGQSPATVERDLVWLEGQGLVPPDVLTLIRARGRGGAGGNGADGK